MTLDHALALLSHTRRDVEEVVPVLVQLATFAHALRQYRSRDDSIESAAELIAHVGLRHSRLGRLPMISRFSAS
jgi:hypothetical protein